jgi:hypothetical protein
MLEEELHKEHVLVEGQLLKSHKALISKKVFIFLISTLFFNLSEFVSIDYQDLLLKKFQTIVSSNQQIEENSNARIRITKRIFEVKKILFYILLN